jgi:hypothetical protein
LDREVPVPSLLPCLLLLAMLLGTPIRDAGAGIVSTRQDTAVPTSADAPRGSPGRSPGLLDILLVGAGCLMVGDVLRGLFMPVSAFSRPKESLRLLPGVKQSQASEAQLPDPADHAWVAAPTPG